MKVYEDFMRIPQGVTSPESVRPHQSRQEVSNNLQAVPENVTISLEQVVEKSSVIYDLP
jgi:hypothetical protein